MHDQRRLSASQEIPAAPLSLDFAFRVGSAPKDDDEALRIFEELTDAQDAQGDLLYLSLVSSRPPADYDFIVAAAKARGLVCFDPQSDSLL